MNLPFIKEFCNLPQTDVSSIGFPERMAIERDLFLAAKFIGKTIGFPVSSIRNFDPAGIPKSQFNERERHLLIEIAEANRMLKILASGDVYLLDNIAGQSLPGRENAIRVFAVRLHRILEKFGEFTTSIDSMKS
jgi:hypothetical protein